MQQGCPVLLVHLADIATPTADLLCGLQRIMGVKYSFPSNLQLSKDCVDLISKVFVGNPANRINIAGIRMHPWFLKNLPEELKVCCLPLSKPCRHATALRCSCTACPRMQVTICSILLCSNVSYADIRESVLALGDYASRISYQRTWHSSAKQSAPAGPLPSSLGPCPCDK